MPFLHSKAILQSYVDSYVLVVILISTYLTLTFKTSVILLTSALIMSNYSLAAIIGSTYINSANERVDGVFILSETKSKGPKV